MKRACRPAISALVLLGFVLGAPRLSSGASIDVELLEEPAFSVPPSVLQELASAHAGDEAEAVILLKEATLSFHADGTRTYRHRQIYRINSEAGAAAWSKTDMVWAPWYQDPPTIRARVVTTARREHWLDPATVGEVPFEESDGDVLSDRRLKIAPLPAIAVGSVVEEARETSPGGR